jgi:hypothetical protein
MIHLAVGVAAAVAGWAFLGRAARARARDDRRLYGWGTWLLYSGFPILLYLSNCLEGGAAGAAVAMDGAARDVALLVLAAVAAVAVFPWARFVTVDARMADHWWASAPAKAVYAATLAGEGVLDWVDGRRFLAAMMGFFAVYWWRWRPYGDGGGWDENVPQPDPDPSARRPA